MGRVVLYIAQSLDGFISREDGAIDWLEQFDGEDYGYQVFLDAVEAVFMGSTTYKQVLSFEGDFPYKNKQVYVFTRDLRKQEDGYATFINQNLKKYINLIKHKTDGICWLVGGAQIIHYFFENNLVDEIRLFTMPIIIGGGVPLFHQLNVDNKLTLFSSKNYQSGVVEAIYKIS